MSVESKALILKLTTLRDLLRKSGCGTGAGGFQPGNTCGRGDGTTRSPEQKERARKRFHKKLRKAFPFLKDKDIGNLTEARGDRASSASLPRDQITAHEHDVIYGTMGEPDNAIRKPREIHSVGSESKTWRLSATVSTNPMHGVMAGEKRYKVEYSAEGPNHRGHDYVDHFNSRTKAIAAAEKGHAGLAKEYAPRLAPKTGPTVKELFKQAGTTPSRMEKLIYKQATPWHDVPPDQRSAWLANERAKIKNANKSAGKGEIRKGPHGAPIAWFDVDTRIAGKVRWGEWTAADERATTGAARGERDGKAFSYVDMKAAAEGGVPTAQAILDGVLAEMGHAEAWADGSLDGDARLEVLHEVRLAGRAWFRGEAQAVLDGLEEKALFGSAKAKVGAFFGRAKKYVRELVVAGVLAVAGPGPANQTDAIVQATQQQVAEQIEYLEKFEAKIVSEAKPLDGTFVANAEQYGNVAWGPPQQVIRDASTTLAIFDEEMREHIGEDTPCSTCSHQAALGWRPIGTLRAIGDSECMSGCHCVFRFRMGSNGVPHAAGRGPLWEAAFGRTG